MLVNIYHDSPAEHRRLMVAGVVFLTVIALLVALSIAIYQKVFTDVTTVKINADRAGLQLTEVRRRPHPRSAGRTGPQGRPGRRAGRDHRGAQPAGGRADPRQRSVEILPTTLFGQKFISFVTPDDPSSTPLADGDVIPASRVTTNVELSRILANLFPLLRSIQPADLNATLNALATALGGRGAQIGDTMDQLDSYLGEIDDHLPTLRPTWSSSPTSPTPTTSPRPTCSACSATSP